MVNIDAKDDFGWTPLMCAAGAGQLNAVAELLSRGANFLSADSKGRDARALAAISGHMGVVQMLDVCHTSVRVPGCGSRKHLVDALAHPPPLQHHIETLRRGRPRPPPEERSAVSQATFGMRGVGLLVHGYCWGEYWLGCGSRDLRANVCRRLVNGNGRVLGNVNGAVCREWHMR
jgi:hypothetical protein